MVLKVITRRERDVPTIGNAKVTADIEVLGELIRIAHRIVIELATGVFSHGDTITQTERPRKIESHITVFVGLCLAGIILTGTMFSTFHILIDIGFNTCIVVVITISTTVAVVL